jgi:hypothetical protein
MARQACHDLSETNTFPIRRSILQRSLTKLVVATAAVLAGLAFAAATASADVHATDTTDNAHITIAPVKSME